MADDSLVAHFIAVTGANEEQAVQMLEATNQDLEQAVGLFFAADMSGSGTADRNVNDPRSSSGHTHIGKDGVEDIDDEALARRLQEEDAAASLGDEEDAVRAPIPTRVERLYGDSIVNHSTGRSRASHPVPPHVVDAFRDFGSANSHLSRAQGNNQLASMFEPPRDILFVGGFEEAKQFAASQERWLVYDITEEGGSLVTCYKVLTLPTILVLDPLTGAPMRQWAGFIEPERLMEDLMPFLDTPVTDPGAARLAMAGKRGRSSSMSQQQQQVSWSLSERDDDGKDEDSDSLLSEDQEVQHSRMESALDTDVTKAPDLEDHKSEPVDPASVALAAESRLPDEPEAPNGCRIGLRLPNGRRIQRRFPKEATMSSIADWCLVEVPEAAAGKSFSLSEAIPGAPPLTDLALTIEAAGVADAMLVVKWNE